MDFSFIDGIICNTLELALHDISKIIQRDGISQPLIRFHCMHVPIQIHVEDRHPEPDECVVYSDWVPEPTNSVLVVIHIAAGEDILTWAFSKEVPKLYHYDSDAITSTSVAEGTTKSYEII